MRRLIEEELRGPSVFKDASKLSFDYVPEHLPGREEEARTLARIFSPLLENPTSGVSALIVGPVGSGKTALSKRFSEDFKEVARKRGRALEWTDVNCRRRSSEPAVLLKILNHFDERFPDRGFSFSEMLDVLRKHLERRGVHLIVILDEVDVLLRRSGSDLIYALTRFHEEGGGSPCGVSLILVSQRDVRDLMDEAAQSTFRRTTTVALSRYTESQLKEIVHSRVELAFHPGAFPSDLEDLVAQMASERGDARLAIEILLRAGQNADDEGRRQVTAEDVRLAKSGLSDLVEEERVRSLDLHRKLVLLAVARCLKRGEAFAMTGEIEEKYSLACEEFGERPRAHTQLWTYLKDLDGRGLLSTRRSGKGVAGSTTLVSLPDVPARALEEKLLEILREEKGE